MSTRRFSARIPSANLISVATLPQHQLMFHKVSKDGSAKCDARLVSGSDHVVVGVLFEIDGREKPHLDECEGLGTGYDQKVVTVITPDELYLEAFTYYATITEASLKPYHWYKGHVLIGAREHRLPRSYIAAIERVASISDPRAERHASELSVYL